MNEHPITFNTEMAQAVYPGNIKTETRRLSELHEVNLHPDQWEVQYRGDHWKENSKTKNIDCYWAQLANKTYPDRKAFAKCPYGKVGDFLYVREKWAKVPETPDNPTGIIYCSEHLDLKDIPWKASIHLRKEHSRLWLTVKEIAIARLYDITEPEAKAEGVTGKIDFTLNGLMNSYRNNFCDLWKKIYGDDNFKINPWVWVVKFELNRDRSKL